MCKKYYFSSNKIITLQCFEVSLYSLFRMAPTVISLRLSSPPYLTLWIPSKDYILSVLIKRYTEFKILFISSYNCIESILNTVQNPQIQTHQELLEKNRV